MGWYDEDEFLGYLASVLKIKKRMSPEFIDYENRSEKSWRLFIEGLICEKINHLTTAREMYKQSILTAGTNDWVNYLSFSRLIPIQAEAETATEHQLPQAEETETFKEKAAAYRKSAAGNRKIMTTLVHQFESDALSYKDKIIVYMKLLDLIPENRTLIGRIAFFHATQSEWQPAIDFIERYFKTPTRETGLSLSLGLLKGEILNIMGKQTSAEDHLTQFSNTIQDPWYGLIIKHLILKKNDEKLIKLAGKNPEKLITAHTALGLWAEAAQNTEKASGHYREALSTYLDDWNEYDLARGRIIGFRQASK